MNFSIIIPMYNVEQYIVRCLESVYQQDFNEQDFEVILVDDESPDNSLQLAKDYLSEKSNFTIISQKNKGLGGARNTGIDKAKGDYIVFLDSDDLLQKKTLEKLSTIVSKYNNLEIIEFGADIVDNDLNVISKITPDILRKPLSGMKYYVQCKTISSACNKLYNKRFLDAYKLRFLERVYIEDSEFNTRAFSSQKNVLSVAIGLASFVQTNNSITRNSNKRVNDKIVKDTITIYKDLRKFELDNSTLNENENKYFNKKWTLFTISIFTQLLKYNYSSSQIKSIKKDLVMNNLFIIDYKLNDKKRELLRKILKNSFPLFLIICFLKKTFKL